MSLLGILLELKKDKVHFMDLVKKSWVGIKAKLFKIITFFLFDAFKTKPSAILQIFLKKGCQFQFQLNRVT